MAWALYYIPFFWSRPAIVYTASLAVFAMTMISLGRPLVQNIFAGKPIAEGRLLRQRVDQLRPRRLIVDEWTLRYVFDYRLRPEMMYAGFTDRRTKDDDPYLVYPDECWVVSAKTTHHYGIPDLRLPQPRMLIGDWVANADEMRIVEPQVH